MVTTSPCDELGPDAPFRVSNSVLSSNAPVCLLLSVILLFIEEVATIVRVST
jgi:hypothetical protein